MEKITPCYNCLGEIPDFANPIFSVLKHFASRNDLPQVYRPVLATNVAE